MTVLSDLKKAILAPSRTKKVKAIAQGLGVLTKKSVFDFGKYKGLTVKEVLKTNPSYIVWLVDNTNQVFAEEVILKARKGKLVQDANRPVRDWGNKWRGAQAHWTHPEDADWDIYEFDHDCPGPWGEGV
jgi:hypothetical protein